ncbi:hypothetical protein MRX96_047411 [Rhipicephalus microplus]
MRRGKQYREDVRQEESSGQRPPGKREDIGKRSPALCEEVRHPIGEEGGREREGKKLGARGRAPSQQLRI